MAHNRLFRGWTVPGWVGVLWFLAVKLYDALDFWGNVEFGLQLRGRARMWDFLLSPRGSLLVLVAGFVWIYTAAVRADNQQRQSEHPDSAGNPRAGSAAKLRWVRTDIEPLDLSRGFTPKVRIEFRSIAQEPVDVSTARWETNGTLRVRSGLPHATWQVRHGAAPWEPQPDGAEHVRVDPGDHCRPWVAFGPSVDEHALGGRIDLQQLGTLVILVNGEEAKFPI